MSNIYDLMAKLQAIEESAKKSDIPAVQRKAQAEKHGDKNSWKVSKQDLEDEEHEGKISHPKTLAKNTGRADESMEDAEQMPAEQPVEECGGDEGMVQLSMKDLIQLVKGLEKDGEPQHDGDPLLGAPGALVGAEQQPGELIDADFDEEFANSQAGDQGPVIKGIAAVTKTGDDMHSKGQVSPAARAPGTNPLRPVSEEMRSRLQQYYEYVKAR